MNFCGGSVSNTKSALISSTGDWVTNKQCACDLVYSAEREENGTEYEYESVSIELSMQTDGETKKCDPFLQQQKEEALNFYMCSGASPEEMVYLSLSFKKSDRGVAETFIIENKNENKYRFQMKFEGRRILGP